jgi:hypothetical protein
LLDPIFIEINGSCTYKSKGCGNCNKSKGHVSHRKKGGTCVFKRQLGCATCGKAKGNEAHMGLPPSFNLLAGRTPQVYMGLKSALQAIILKHLVSSDLEQCSKIMVEGELTFPEPGNRDQGNFRVLLEKALGDALVEGGWIADDNWEMYEFGNLGYRVEPGVMRTRLLLMSSNVER